METPRAALLRCRGPSRDGVACGVTLAPHSDYRPEHAARDAWLLPTLATVLSPTALQWLRETARGSYWESCVAARLASDAQILRALSARFRMPIAPAGVRSPRARELVPETLARRYGVLPVDATDAELHVATADPHDIDGERALAFATGRRVRVLLASPSQISRGLDDLYRAESRVDRLLDGVAAYGDGAGSTPEMALDGSEGEAADRPVLRLVDHIVSEAVAARASDVHVEMEEAAVAVRCRIDGVLRQTMALPKGIGGPLVSRVKIMARLDIADRLRPQDGRARVTVGGRAVDLRVSTLPSAHGEKVVIRILDQQRGILSLEAMGMAGEELRRVDRLLAAREGLVLVTGPTGSGKTTTLYSMLKTVQQRGVNVVTVEDPVEYRLPGIVQVQVHERAGLTFAAALRSILRQDPDVILVGEIRDQETAEVAVQAALTGHLVFSTLHTIDSAGAIARLADLGVEPFKLAAALRGVIAQRLVRRICGACRGPRPDAPDGLADGASSAKGVGGAARGCGECAGSGYRGRIAVSEVLVVDAEVERRIAAGATIEQVAAAARAAGMRTLWEVGRAHEAAGATTVAELARVIEAPPASLDTAVPLRSGAPEAPSPLAAAEGAAPALASPALSPPPPPDRLEERRVTELRVGVVDVYVIRRAGGGWEFLALQRGAGTRCPGAWEAVHGRLEEGERPEAGALRELREETGLDVERLYNVTVQGFYLHTLGVVQLAVAFAAVVPPEAPLTLGDEHAAWEWLPAGEARARFAWPREREAVDHITALLAGGDAGAVEDVLRVR